ncbi:MAG: palindromic element RPE4 domain-containing protein [Janthinobacterium lividum]
MPAWIILPCHPVIYSRDPVKNTNKISIFYYFLDTVDKPRYDYLRAFFDLRGQCQHRMTINNKND